MARPSPSLVNDDALCQLVQRHTHRYLQNLGAKLPPTVDTGSTAFVSIAIGLLRGGVRREELDMLLDLAQETVTPEKASEREVVLRSNSAAARRLRRMPIAGSA